MISVKHNSTITVNDTDRHRNLLIIGAADTDYMNNKIIYYSSSIIVKSLYGENSELAQAFVLAKDAGVSDIYLCNVKFKTDYIELVDIFKQNDFAYIVPLGIKFSDSFYNPIVERNMTYAELYADSMGMNESLIIMTDFHASLYEDMDSFLNEMKSNIESFITVAYGALRNGRNLCFVANNLKDYKFSNLMLGISLCLAPFNTYPTYTFGEAIFDIDDFDVGDFEIIYYKKNTLAPTSVENLKNFRIDKDAAKIINIDRVIKFIGRELDFSDFQGKIFTEYVRVKIEAKLIDFLSSIKNTAILDHTIKSVEFIKTDNGSGSIINTFSIFPINSVEELEIAMEV